MRKPNGSAASSQVDSAVDVERCPNGTLERRTEWPPHLYSIVAVLLILPCLFFFPPEQRSTMGSGARHAPPRGELRIDPECTSFPAHICALDGAATWAGTMISFHRRPSSRDRPEKQDFRFPSPSAEVANRWAARRGVS